MPTSRRISPKIDRTEIAHAAHNNDTQAVLLMLEAGLPVSARGQHRGTPLHWAAWHGNLDLVRALLRSNPPLEDAENDFHATPMGWATHGSEHGWHRKSGTIPPWWKPCSRPGQSFLKRFRGLRPSKKCYTVTAARTVSLESKRSPIGDEGTVLRSSNASKRPRIANHMAGILARRLDRPKPPRPNQLRCPTTPKHSST